jgi:hypothetical protein
MRVNMNYYIEKHDMKIILDALENLVEDMKHAKDNGHFNYAYSIEDVDGLFQSFDNSFHYDPDQDYSQSDNYLVVGNVTQND